MGMLMKGLKFVGLGVAIWGLSLLWPEVNRVLTLPVMIGVAALACVLGQRLDQRHDRDGAGQDHLSHAIPAVLTPQEYLPELAEPVI